MKFSSSLNICEIIRSRLQGPDIDRSTIRQIKYLDGGKFKHG